MKRSSQAERRKSILLHAERLFASQGYAATGVNQILEESDLRRSSLYTKFPGGKEELVLELLLLVRDRLKSDIGGLLDDRTLQPAEFVRRLCDSAAHDVRESLWTRGSVLQCLASEVAHTSPLVADRLYDIYGLWGALVQGGIRGALNDPAEEERFAMALIAALEGARGLSRVRHDTLPFEVVARTFSSLLGSPCTSPAALR
jgi:TetR/AcrR family transcriptional repressor of lmrAB and yxaGH operons